eukprot:gene17198-20459_t
MSSDYGHGLASAVAKKLKTTDCTYLHRDYCGTGFVYFSEAFYYVTVNDGYPDGYPDYSGISGRAENGNPPGKWESDEEFVNWLANQSDASLCGDGNQRITKERLENFVNRRHS